MRSILFSLAFLFCLSFAEKVSYKDYSIAECSIESEDVKDLLLGIINAFDIDVLSRKAESLTILVEPRRKALFEGLHCVSVVEDLQKAIDEEEKEMHFNRARFARSLILNDTDPYHQVYHRYDEIIDKVQEIAKEYPSLVSYSVAGKSLEGRDIPLVKITGEGKNKKSIFINGGIHAREWISSATVVYLIQNLAGKYGKDSKVTSLLNQVEFYIIPASNPDGYEYTWTNDRMWRKNRNPNGGGACVGVDLNRNFDVYWGTGSSGSKCAGDYHGESPASEPETKTVQGVVDSLPNLIGAIDVHAFGQYIMRPYGWTYDRHPEEATLKKLGDEMVEIIRQTNGVRYSSIRSAELYPVSGASDDWFTVKKNLWGFCFELRDQGRYGFRLPENQILPTAQEIFAAIVHYGGFVLENFKI